MRRSLCFFLAALFALGLAACGTSPTQSTEPTSDEMTSLDGITTLDENTEAALPAGAEPATGEGSSEASRLTGSQGTAPTQSANQQTQTTNQPTQTTLPPTASETVRIIIPEGFTFYQVARRLEANGVCTAKDFTEAAQAYQIQSFYAPISPQACYRLEGMLFPDTYEFYVGEDPIIVIRKLLNNYAEKTGLPDYDTLILASVIERETRSDSHMAMVSSVFHNRLRQGMPLQADATRAYVRDHIKADPLVSNPARYEALYDTYQCRALPEGPICSPGLRAIEAAKNPSQSDYLYYFFGKDETNHYTYTYEEHLAAIKMYGLG